MQKKRLISIILCFSIVFSVAFISNAPKANAWWTAIPNALIEGLGTAAAWAKKAYDESAAIQKTVGSIIITATKVATLLAIQKTMQVMLGKGDQGGVVTDWNNYLFVSPQQRAMTQMNSFFNTASRGRLSSLNYEGVGPNYDAYLISQAKQSIAGQNFSTNIQSIVTDPKQMFAGGNMKGIMSYMECPNNPACYSLAAQNQYATELATATKIAEMEQANGFLPAKKNGRIVQPAAIVGSALTQIDQLGTQIIMNADAQLGVKAGMMQIAGGAAINGFARALNYTTSDSAGKAAIRNKNDEFPFSVGYSLTSGFGIGVGGVNYGTGVGAVGAAMQFGNTCGVGGFEVGPTGVAVIVTGAKVKCTYTGTRSSGTAPSIDATCKNNAECDTACTINPICVANTLKCNLATRKCINK